MNFLFIHKWHKRIGIVTACFVLFLAITGLLLNHTSELDLSSKYVTLDWLLNWYEIQPDEKAKSYALDDNYITQLGERLYFNADEIVEDAQQLIGAVPVDDFYIAAYDQNLILLSKTGEVIEILSGTDGVPAGMNKLGLDDSAGLVIDAAHGYYHVNIETLKWHEEDEAEATWPEQVMLNDQLYERIEENYRGKGLPLERVIQDIHSGRILGLGGVYFMDAVALLFCILAISGIYMWIRRH